MPEPKSPGRSTSSKRKGSARAPAKAAKASSRSTASTGRSARSAAVPAAKTARRTTRQGAAAEPAAEPATASKPRAHSAEDAVGAALSAIRSSLARGLVLTGERLQETIDDAAKRGRLTHRDAEDLAQRLISAGRKQTDDLLRELEQVVGRGGDELIRASREFRKKLR